MTHRTQSSTDILSHDLVSNYLNAAIGHSDFSAAAAGVASEEYWKSAGQTVRRKPVPRRRVIAVVGAGASFAYHNTCLGGAAADRVRDMVCGLPTGSHARTFYAGVAQKLIPTNPASNVFEDVMLVCATLDLQTTYVALEKIFGKAANPYVPAFGYEFLAHLLKHRFIDAIVNFNFDELLDEAIEGELARNEYYRVLADSECLEVRESEGSFSRPIYIKPHGTIGHRATLRFTRAEYANIPDGIEQLLTKLITNQPTTIWTIGFGMESIDFNKIIREKIAPQSRLVSLDLRAPNFTCENLKLTILPLIKTTPKVSSLTAKLQQIWKTVNRLLSPGFKPRSIARHEVLDQLFRGSARKGNAAEILNHRISLELAFAIAKSKGFISMKDVGNGRAQRVWDQLKLSDGNPTPLIDRCQAWGLQPISYSPYALRFDGAAKKGTPLSLPPKRVAELLAAGWNGLPPANQRVRKFVKKAFKDIASGDEVEISPELAAEGSAAFRSPTRITSKLELAALTDHLLAGRQWRTMVSVAETGEWLLERRIQTLIEKRRKRSLGLIITDDGSHGGRLLTAYEGILRREAIGELAWWSHNHHMTVFLELNEAGNLAAHDAIFFVRRLRASRVAPFWLRGPDAADAFKIYVAYWHKAKHPGKHVDDKAIQTGYNELGEVFECKLQQPAGAEATRTRRARDAGRR